jgi:hypothetical protein
MANVSRDNVWVIDTASADPISTDDIYIHALRWVSTAASAGDQVVVTNAAGDVVWEAFATGANYTEESQVPLRITDGLAVPTLDSGILYLYHLLKP